MRGSSQFLLERDRCEGHGVQTRHQALLFGPLCALQADLLDLSQRSECSGSQGHSLVSSRVWLSWPGVLVMLAVWLARLRAPRFLMFESRSRHF